MTMAPAPRPCGSCPYRRDVPSGIWAEEEYAKLPGYDLATGMQPPSAFHCHQQDGHLCAGWVATHDMEHSLGLRLLAAAGTLTEQDIDAVLDYETDVPVFASGAEAAKHGLRNLRQPDQRAVRTIKRLARKVER